MAGETTEEKYKKAAITFAAIIGGAVVASMALFLVYQIRGALLPFIYAAIIVYLARPFVDLMVKIKLPRTAAVITAYFTVLALLTLLIVFVVPLVVDQVNELIGLLPKFFEAGQKYVSDLKFKIPKELDGIFVEAQDRASKIAIGLASAFPVTAFGFFGGIFNAVLAWLLAFYILKDLPQIKEAMIEFVPEKHRDNVRHVFREIDFAVGGYLRGQLIVAITVGVMVSIYLSILGVEFALLLGLLAGVLNIIPYFGAIVGGGAAAIVAAFTSFQLAIVVILGMIVIQQIDGAIISPTVMRHTVNLHPTMVVLSLLIGATLFGIIGLLFAIPIAAAAKALLLHFVYEKPVDTSPET